MPQIVASIGAEYRRYKALGEAALAQLSDDELCRAPSDDDNSVAMLVWHVAGNLESRFTEFRTSDGEKPWRDRDDEFEPRQVTRAELFEKWERGWRAVLAAVDALTDADLDRSVTIRRQPLRVDEALHRSLSHTAYHIGQIVFLGKLIRGSAWRTLSIPRGGSRAYNQAPRFEKPASHERSLTERKG